MANTAKHYEFAIIGLGRFGLSLALELAAQGHSVMGIDIDPVPVQTYAEELTHTVTLDASDEDALRAIEITAFDTVVVAIGANFEANLMATVALKSLGVRRVICKALTRRQAYILERVGADQVVLPEEEAGRRLALQLSVPSLRNLIPLEPGYSLVEMPVPPRYVGHTLEQAGIHSRYKLTVLVVRRNHDTLVSPPPSLALEAKDLLVVIGPDSGIAQFSA